MSGIALPGVFKGSPSSLNMSNMPVNMSSTGPLYQSVPSNSHQANSLPSSSLPLHPTPTPVPALLPKVEAPDTGPEPDKEEPKDESPEVDIVINNVVCSFSVRCHLNLKEIALNGSNVEYRRENGMVTMKLRLVFINVIICLVHVLKCQAPLHHCLYLEFGENHLHGG